MLRSRFRMPSYRHFRSVGRGSFVLPGRALGRVYRRARSRPAVAVAAATALVLVVSLLSFGWADRSGPAKSPGPLSTPPRVGELPERATATSDTRRNEDGSYTTTVYVDPVNYRADDGSMRRIDPTLHLADEGGYAWRSGANSFEARFKDRAEPEFNEIRIGDRMFRVTAEGVSPAKARVDGARISYPGAYPGADLTYTVTPTGVKEVIDLAGPDAPTSYAFRLVADDKGPAPSVQRRPDGSYAVIVPPRHGPAFVFEAPVVQESAGEREVAPPAPEAKPSLRVDRQGRDLLVTLSLNEAWLRAPDRQFPVHLDPTMTIQPDVEDASFTTLANYLPYVNERLFIGGGTQYNWRAALQFDLGGLPADAQVTDAKLGLYFDGWCITSSGPFCGGTEHVMDAHRMTSAWSTSTTSDRLTFDATATGSYTLPSSLPQGWMNWPITNTVKAWASGTQPNYGLLVKRRSETLNSSGPTPPGRRFTGSADLQPRLEITYTSDAVDLLVPETLHGNGADLAWTRYTGPSGAPFEKYEVHRAPGSGTFTPSASTLLTTITNASVTAYRDTTAAPNKTFTYRVVANNSASNPRTVTLPAAGQASKVLQPGPAAGRNTYLYYASGIVNCWGYGTGTSAWVGTNASSKWRDAVWFDLRDIPTNATITNATASFWQQYSSSVPLTVQAHRITRPWKEGTTANQCSDGATWYNAEAGVPWTAQGGDVDGTVAARLDVPAGSPQAFHNFTITNLVQNWVNGSAPNNGFLLRAADETLRDGNSVVYATDDYTASAALRPKLSVTYTDGSVAQGPVASLAAPGPGSTVSGNSVRLAATAQDDRRVDKVEFLVDGSVVGQDASAPYEITWNSASVANGARSISVRATDDAGNVTTSAAVSVTVDNTAPPTGSLTAPAAGATVAGTSVTLSATASDDVGVRQVEFLIDGVRVGAPDTTSPYSITWNTVDLLAPAYNGAHEISAVVTDTSGQQYVTAARSVTVDNVGSSPQAVTYALNSPNDATDDVMPPAMVENTAAGVPVQDPYAGTTRPDGTSGGSLNRALADAPQPDAGTPPPSCPANAYCPTVTVTNASTTTWDNSTAEVWYRWYAPNGAIMFEGRSSATFPSKFRKGANATFPLTIYPPALPPGIQEGTYRLRIDVWDPATSAWLSGKGNAPVDHPVLVAKSLATKLGLERYYQYDAEAAGAGMSTLTNIANGDMLVRWTPLFAPGRGLSTMADLTYNSLEDHSRSPAGNNFSLSISGLTRLGQPLDIHPNKADEISGRSNKWVEFTDGDGTTHRFDGTTGSDGVTRWQEPSGVNLYLRSLPDGDPNGRWALTRPDKVTYYFDADGFPLSVQDRNDNRIRFALEDTPPGEDPGGPKKRVTKVTDAGGRSFVIDYWSKAEAKKAHVRGNIQSITDHSGTILKFDYYDDGNLLRLTQSGGPNGGTNADGSFLADRSFVFTYTTSNGAGPAIGADDATGTAARRTPEPKTANQSTRLYSVIDPRGNETRFAYYQATDGAHLRWKLKSRTNRAGHVTSYGYDLTNRVTTVTAPLSRVIKYTYDTSGKVTSIVNAKNETTGVQWSADFKVTRVTEPTGRFSTWTYNANGYPLTQTNQAGETTKLTYIDESVDVNDAGKHLSWLETLTTPRGVATTGDDSDYRWTYSYDSGRNVDKIIDPVGAVTDYDYNLAGSANPGTVAAIRDANGNAPTTIPAYDPSGQPATIVDPLGNTTRIGYDADGNVRWIQDPNHANASGTDERAYRTYFDYDSFGRLGRQSAPKSTATDRGTLLYSGSRFDANDNVVETMDAHYGSVSGGDPQTGATTRTTYDVMDRPDRITDPENHVTDVDHDAAGRTSKVTKPKGVASTTVTDDYATVYGYDLLDRVIKQTAYGTSTSDVRVTQMCYDLAGNLRSVTTPRAGTATITCPGNGPAVAPYTSETDYDAAHRPVVQRDELGHAKRTEYDDNGNVSAVEADIATGRVSRAEIDHNQRDEPTQIRERFDGSRVVTTLIEYDKNGNQTKTVSPRAYDTHAGTGDHYITVNRYDAVNRLIRVDLPYNSADGTERQYVHHAYDANGNLAWTSLPVTTATASGVAGTAKTVTEYFDPGWIRNSDDPANPKVHFDYNALGLQTKRQPEKRSAPGTLDDDDQMFWTYYPDGQLRSRTDREGQINRYEYDAHELLSRAFENGLSDPGEKEIETWPTYTGFDEPDRVRHRKQGATAWTFTDYDYDANGNTILRLENGEDNGAGTQSKAPRRIQLTYDGADWLSEQLDLGTDGAGLCKDDTRTVNTWWATGWEKQRDVYRAAATCTTTPSTWPKKQTTTWTHFDNGKLRNLVTRNGAGAVTESHGVGYFDSAGDYVNGNRTTDRYVLERENVSGTNGATTCEAASPCDAVYTYDARDRLLSHQLRAGKTNTYRLDEPAKLIGDTTIRAGNVTTEIKNGTTTSKRYTGGQLTEITVGGTTGKYWYDDWGNVDCLTLAAGSQANCSPSDNTTASANLITDYGYDYLNRLTKLRQYSGGTRTDRTSYTYDALDRTTKEIEEHSGVTTRTTDFTYQGLSGLATEEKQTGGTNPRTKTFSYDAYGHRIGMADKATGSTSEPDKYTYSQDVHSSVSQLINDAGQVKASYGYDAYGGSDAPSSDSQSLTTGDTDKLNLVNPYRYGGKRVDTGTASTGATPSPVPNGSGGYDMGARRYGPDTGSFLQQDMFPGAMANLGLALDPLTQNRYALAGGNPISYIETDGHMVIADGGGGGAVTPTPTPSPSPTPGPGPSGGSRTPNPQPGPSPTAPPQPPPCAGVWLNGQCFTGPQLRQGNIDNGSTQFAINRAMSQGGTCEVGAKQIICTGSSGYLVEKGDADHWPQAQTIGDVMLYPGTKDELRRNLNSEASQRARVANTCDKYGTCLDPDVFGKDLLEHEAAHSDQWQHYSSVADYGAAYAAEQGNSFILCPDGGIGACNKFEIGANPFKGGYWDPPQVVNGVFAPGDNWPDRIREMSGY